MESKLQEAGGFRLELPIRLTEYRPITYKSEYGGVFVSQNHVAEYGDDTTPVGLD
jgi:hypothetical protein